MQLVQEETFVLVTVPEDAQPPHQPIAQLQEEAQSFVQSLQADNKQLQADNTQLQNTVVRHWRLQNALALRALLDDARTELAGHELQPNERGEAWNAVLANMTDFKGMSRDAAMLTQYGPNTPQRQFSRAAHSFNHLEIAEAVTNATKNGSLLKELFKHLYGMEAEEAIFQAERGSWL